MTATISVDLTPATPEPIKSDEAARGARRLQLQAIDLFWDHIVFDIRDQQTEEMGELAEKLWAEVRELTGGFRVGGTPVLDTPVLDGVDEVARIDDPHLLGHPAAWAIARRHIVQLALEAHLEAIRIDVRADLSVLDARAQQARERKPFDFEGAPPSEHRNEAAK